jgi:Peptidase A4 family
MSHLVITDDTEDFPDGFTRPVPPPPDFDPKTACNSDLMKYRYPPRPGRNAPPELKHLWHLFISGKFEYVDTYPIRLVTDTARVEALLRRPLRPDIISSGSSPGWSGVIMNNPPAGQSFQVMSGVFTVPGATLPILPAPNDDAFYAVVASVGLINSKIPETELNAITINTVSVFQLSNGAIVPGSQSTTLYLVQGPKITAPALEVSPRDTVMFGLSSEIVYPSTKVSTAIIMSNTTTKKYIPDIYVTPPFNADTALWIVSNNEIYDLAEQTVSSPTPTFPTVTFTYVEAGAGPLDSGAAEWFNLTTGNVEYLYRNLSEYGVITTSTVSDTSFQVYPCIIL